MAFAPHNVQDAQWANFYRIASTDALYPPITATVTDSQEFAGTTVQTTEITSRFAIIVEDYKAFSNTNSISATTVPVGSVQILSATVNRKGYKVVNTGGASVYLLEGAGTASISNQTVTVAAGANYSSINPTWTGAVNIISSSGNNVCVVTEYS